MYFVTHTDFGDPEMVDFDRFRPIIGLDSDTKALLRLPKPDCVSPAVFPNGWHARPRFAGPKSSKITDFRRQIDSIQLRKLLADSDLSGRSLVKRLKEPPSSAELVLLIVNHIRF